MLAINLSNQAPMIPQSRMECKLDKSELQNSTISPQQLTSQENIWRLVRIPSPPPWSIGWGIADSVEIYKKPGYQ